MHVWYIPGEILTMIQIIINCGQSSRLVSYPYSKRLLVDGCENITRTFCFLSDEYPKGTGFFRSEYYIIETRSDSRNGVSECERKLTRRHISKYDFSLNFKYIYQVSLLTLDVTFENVIRNAISFIRGLVYNDIKVLLSNIQTRTFSQTVIIGNENENVM